LRNRGFSFADAAPGPSGGAVATPPPLEDLIPEERIKRELHPLDAYPLLLQHADGESGTRPREHLSLQMEWPLLTSRRNRTAYTARLRIPGGQLFSFQLRELAAIADELTSGYTQITTRANLQMRLIQPRDTIEFLRRVQGTGLHTRGAGADNVRNLTCDPTSGFAPEELIETMPLTQGLAQLILNHREFYDLPRKFNIAFYGGGPIPTVEDTNDIGFRAVRIEASKTALPQSNPACTSAWRSAVPPDTRPLPATSACW
jgi:ferredoxin-nitrite reductase